MDPGFPKLIADSWNGIPDGIDAAFSLNEIGKYNFLYLYRYLNRNTGQIKILTSLRALGECQRDIEVITIMRGSRKCAPHLMEIHQIVVKPQISTS